MSSDRKVVLQERASRRTGAEAPETAAASTGSADRSPGAGTQAPTGSSALLGGDSGSSLIKPKIVEINRTITTDENGGPSYLEAHFTTEAKLGFPVPPIHQDRMRKLLSLSGQVSTTGHQTAKPKQPLAAKPQSGWAKASPSTTKPDRLVEDSVQIRSEADFHIFVLDQADAGFPVDDGLAERSLALLRLQGWVRMTSRTLVRATPATALVVSPETKDGATA